MMMVLLRLASDSFSGSLVRRIKNDQLLFVDICIMLARGTSLLAFVWCVFSLCNNHN